VGPGVGVELEGLRPDATFQREVERHAARAVAAHLGDAAVRVEHLHEGASIARPGAQHSVRADPAVAVAQPARVVRSEQSDGVRVVDHQKVVSEALVLLETQLHDKDRGAGPTRCKVGVAAPSLAPPSR
jgi:hypothetical protein